MTHGLLPPLFRDKAQTFGFVLFEEFDCPQFRLCIHNRCIYIYIYICQCKGWLTVNASACIYIYIYGIYAYDICPAKATPLCFLHIHLAIFGCMKKCPLFPQQLSSNHCLRRNGRFGTKLEDYFLILLTCQ